MSAPEDGSVTLTAEEVETLSNWVLQVLEDTGVDDLPEAADSAELAVLAKIGIE